MSNKQTAVEWLIEQLEQKGDAWVNASIGRMQISIKEEEYIDLINQAKSMEKEQIKSDFHNSVVAMAMGKIMSPEQYYNETYGKE